MVIPAAELDTLKYIQMDVQELITTLGIRAEEYQFLRDSIEYRMARNTAEQTYLWLDKLIDRWDPRLRPQTEGNQSDEQTERQR